MGVDFGGKRVGVSISDEEKNFAFPHRVLENNSNLIDEVVSIIKKEGVEKVIVGESKNLDFKDNPIMEGVNRFVKGLKERGSIPVEMYSEMFTSQAAARIAPKDDMHDARAAALILQGYLDSKRK